MVNFHFNDNPNYRVCSSVWAAGWYTNCFKSIVRKNYFKLCKRVFESHLHGRFEDAFNRFVDEINVLAAYQWWEGSIYSILSILAYPLAWSWLQQRRKMKLQQLRELVWSEYDHSCLRSCRSRALYEGLKVPSSKIFSQICSIILCKAFLWTCYMLWYQ